MRYYTDCREMPSQANCTVAIVADSRDEVIDAAVQHMVAVHEHEDNRELREGVEKNMHQTEQDLPAR